MCHAVVVIPHVSRGIAGCIGRNLGRCYHVEEVGKAKKLDFNIFFHIFSPTPRTLNAFKPERPPWEEVAGHGGGEFFFFFSKQLRVGRNPCGGVDFFAVSKQFCTY